MLEGVEGGVRGEGEGEGEGEGKGDNSGKNGPMDILHNTSTATTIPSATDDRCKEILSELASLRQELAISSSASHSIGDQGAKQGSSDRSDLSGRRKGKKRDAAQLESEGEGIGTDGEAHTEVVGERIVVARIQQLVAEARKLLT